MEMPIRAVTPELQELGMNNWLLWIFPLLLILLGAFIGYGIGRVRRKRFEQQARDLLAALKEHGVPGGPVWNAYWSLHQAIYQDRMGK